MLLCSTIQILQFKITMKSIKLFVFFGIFLLISLLISTENFAQNAPKYSNEFLNIGVGGRGLAMAGVQTAATNDVTAAYWNPAGLLNIKEKYQFGAMHAEYFAGIAQYDYLGFATKVDSLSSIGISAVRFGVDDIPDTRFLFDVAGNQNDPKYLYNANGAINYNNIRFFSSADYAFSISYARKHGLIKGLSWGTNFKVIYRQAGEFANAWGFGLDLGAKYERNGWQFGAMAKDVLGTFTAWNHNVNAIYATYIQTGNPIPQNSVEVTLPKLNLGVAKRFAVQGNFGLLGAIELASTFDGRRNVLIKSKLISIDPKIGVEADFKQKVFLRAGMGEIQQLRNFDKTTYNTFQINFGVGLKLGNFCIDYALTDTANTAEALYSNFFSVRVGF